MTSFKLPLALVGIVIALLLGTKVIAAPQLPTHATATTTASVDAHAAADGAESQVPADDDDCGDAATSAYAGWATITHIDCGWTGLYFVPFIPGWNVVRCAGCGRMFRAFVIG